jgi:hypothetical protein
MAWIPDGSSYRNDKYFYFDVRTANSNDADGGLLGYYAVSKNSARVYDISVTPKPLSGAGLDEAIRTLRAKHCMTDSIPDTPDD